VKSTRAMQGRVIASGEIDKAQQMYLSLRNIRPRNKRDLKNYVKAFFSIDIPDAAICEWHNSPMDYLWHSFNADFGSVRVANSDAVVWANRSGGKTELAAVATLLDCVFSQNVRCEYWRALESRLEGCMTILSGFSGVVLKDFFPVRYAGTAAGSPTVRRWRF